MPIRELMIIPFQVGMLVAWSMLTFINIIIKKTIPTHIRISKKDIISIFFT